MLIKSGSRVSQKGRGKGRFFFNVEEKRNEDKKTNLGEGNNNETQRNTVKESSLEKGTLKEGIN